MTTETVIMFIYADNAHVMKSIVIFINKSKTFNAAGKDYIHVCINLYKLYDAFAIFNRIKSRKITLKHSSFMTRYSAWHVSIMISEIVRSPILN